MEQIEQANRVLRAGFIPELRATTRLSRSYIAFLLQMRTERIKVWETGLFTTVTEGTALKVLALHASYLDASSALSARNVSWDKLINRREAAMLLGVGTYALDNRMDNRNFKYLDFGMLGQWIVRDLLEYLR